MKHEPPPLRITSPCPKDWNGMTGDGKRRFCVCALLAALIPFAFSACSSRSKNMSVGCDLNNFAKVMSGNAKTPPGPPPTASEIRKMRRDARKLMAEIPTVNYSEPKRHFTPILISDEVIPAENSAPSGPDSALKPAARKTQNR